MLWISSWYFKHVTMYYGFKLVKKMNFIPIAGCHELPVVALVIVKQTVVPLNFTFRFVRCYHGLKTWPLANAIVLLLIFWNKLFISLNPNQQIVIFYWCPHKKSQNLTLFRNICPCICAKYGWSFFLHLLMSW